MNDTKILFSNNFVQDQNFDGFSSLFLSLFLTSHGLKNAGAGQLSLVQLSCMGQVPYL
jgi:hypothetical protein